MSVAPCLCSDQEKNICNYGGLSAVNYLPHQRLLSGTKSITNAEFPNNSQMLEAADLEYIYLLQKYTPRLKQILEKIIGTAKSQTIVLEFKFDNHSVIAFLNKQHAVFVWSELRGGTHDESFEINTLILSQSLHNLKFKLRGMH